VTARGLLVTKHASHACSSGPDGPRAPAPGPPGPVPLPPTARTLTPARAHPTSDCTRTASHNTRQPCMQLGPDGPRAREPRPPRPRSPLPATARTLTPARAHPTSDCTRTARHNTRQPSMQLGPRHGPRAPAPPRPGPGRRCRQQPAHSPRPERTPRVTARGLLGTTHASQACSSDPTAREPRPRRPAPVRCRQQPAHSPRPERTPRVTARGLLGTTHASPVMQLRTRRGREPRPPRPRPRPRSPLPPTACTLTPARAHPTSELHEDC